MCRELIQEPPSSKTRSEEHTSELQSPCNLVCRLLLEKKNAVDCTRVGQPDGLNRVGPEQPGRFGAESRRGPGGQLVRRHHHDNEPACRALISSLREAA